MKVLFDTNIVLDVLLDRKPFSEHASYLMSKVERSEINGFLCATTVTTVHYLLSKHLDKEKAITSINSIMGLFEVAPVITVLNIINKNFCSTFIFYRFLKFTYLFSN